MAKPAISALAELASPLPCFATQPHCPRRAYRRGTISGVADRHLFGVELVTAYVSGRSSEIDPLHRVLLPASALGAYPVLRFRKRDLSCSPDRWTANRTETCLLSASSDLAKEAQGRALSVAIVLSSELSPRSLSG